MNECDKSTCRGGPTGGIHRLPIRTHPVAEAPPQGGATPWRKSEPGAAEKSFTKSLTAKTTETRYRDPLQRLRTPRKRRKKVDEAKAVKRKFQKVLDGPKETD